MVGGAGSLLVAEGGPRVVDTPDFPDAYKGEALAHADVLDALRATDSNVDWFYVSPAAAFGAHAGVAPKGSFQVGGDILLTDAEGTPPSRAKITHTLSSTRSRLRHTVASVSPSHTEHEQPS
ncbi:hypothetical protein GCM10020255_031960 [Rhodococcus baikonurensis]